MSCSCLRLSTMRAIPNRIINIEYSNNKQLAKIDWDIVKTTIQIIDVLIEGNKTFFETPGILNVNNTIIGIINGIRTNSQS